MDALGLLPDADPGPAGAARGVDQQGGHEGGVDVVAHRIRDGQVQGVVVEGVVVGVPGAAVGRYQGGGEGELGGLAGGRGGQELALDLRGEAHRGGALAPVVQVGEATVGDHDVRQRVRGLLDLLQYVLGDVGQPQFEHPDGVASVGDRCEDPLSTPAVRRPHQLLGAQDLVVEAACQRDLVGAAPLLGGRLLGDAYHAAPDDVDEEERHVLRAEPVAQVARDHVE